MYTPSSQLGASTTSGTVVERRPPNTKAEIGTPAGSSQAGSIDGHCEAGTVKRALACAAKRPFLPSSGVQGLPCQSLSLVGASSVMPSHHTSPSAVSATLVKITLRSSIFIAFGLVASEVPGATPNNPYSGLMARKRPSGPGFIHAMSSPIVVTFQPLYAAGGISIARLVLPQAEGNAAAIKVFSPEGACTPRISMCSASQPSSRAITEAMRSAR